MDANIQKYQAFVTAVEQKSFTRAAAVLNYSQSGIIRIGTFSSVAAHWLPKIIKAFRQDHPRIEYELLLGDYTEIEGWIAEKRVDCGFLRLPTLPRFETVFLEQDKLMVLLPPDHPLADCDVFPLEALERDPFLLLEKDQNIVVSHIFRKYRLKPNIQFTTWDDYAIMSMVEAGLGISILPGLILRRIPYRVVIKELEVPAYRKIGLAMLDKKGGSAAMKAFLKYLDKR